VQARLPTEELKNYVIPSLVIPNGVKGLVQVGHQMHDPLEGLLPNGSVLGGVSKQTEGPLDGRGYTATRTVALGIVA